MERIIGGDFQVARPGGGARVTPATLGRTGALASGKRPIPYVRKLTQKYSVVQEWPKR